MHEVLSDKLMLQTTTSSKTVAITIWVYIQENVLRLDDLVKGTIYTVCINFKICQATHEAKYSSHARDW